MPPTLDKAARKYIEKHAEAEVHAGAGLADMPPVYAAVVTIPACGEGQSLFATLASIPRVPLGRVAVVITVNENQEAASEVRELNRETLRRLMDSPGFPLASNVSLYPGAKHDIIAIDRTGENALPRGQGVGLARKVAADFAIGLWARGGLRSNWIHSTDADALLPVDYFERHHEGAVAQLYDFRHDGGDAILEYEIFLRYSVLGLHSAGSPWAWHAIGSTLAIDAAAYTKVRGFPRREAAEDFHLLAKLSKLGPVVPARGLPVRLDDRASDRVPFGTGRAMLKAREREASGAPYLVHDPRVYVGLAAWQRALETLGRTPGLGVPEAIESSCERLGLDPFELQSAVDTVGLVQSTKNLLQKQRDPARHLNENFDALATLRLLHALRDRGLPEIPLLDAVATAPFLAPEVRAAAPDLEALREALVRQECRCLR